MVDTNQYTKTHELYTQFSQWLGVDSTIDSNYFMINYSLYAAEAYIKNYYNIDLTLGTTFEKVNKSGVFSPTSNPTKILNVFIGGELSYPTINYLDSDTFSIAEELGDYTLDMDLSGHTTADYYSTYLTGYVYNDTTDYSTIDFDDDDRLPTPRLLNDKGVAITSPYETVGDTLSVTIIGTPLSIVELNNIAIGSLEDDGTLVYSASLAEEVSTLSFRLVDPSDEEITSQKVKVLVVKSQSMPTPYLEVLGYDLKVADLNVNVVVCCPIGSSIYVNGEEFTVSTSLITHLVLPITPETSTETIDFSINAVYDDISSATRRVRTEYNSSYNASYIAELNKNTFYVPYLPDDLLIGVFKLANHFYTGTLYNNNSTESFRTANDISTTYLSHSIPSDVKALLSVYAYFRP